MVLNSALVSSSAQFVRNERKSSPSKIRDSRRLFHAVLFDPSYSAEALRNLSQRAIAMIVAHNRRA